MSERIKKYQKKIYDLGIKNIKVDGVHGQLTNMFVLGIQHSVGIKEDGIVGNITLRAIENLRKSIETKHFKRSEFKCKCCGYVKNIPISLLIYLETIRRYFNEKPVVISSGYRCEQHNTHVGGGEYSQHLKGKAADLYVIGVNAYKVYRFCNEFIFMYNGGVGRYSSFTHIDVRNKKSRWSG